ncbi:MarR family winged helix-turn-helix transcriptional regulator [Camelliibacillus cellulosilyticus]|uniref:MarR family winged helix-turn-helix transcriptional regulator n=1 Tax=Camelliibacillus cellulosilyticus TaxID=2174486 RepID=A0ABV9GKN9_9BACL
MTEQNQDPSLKLWIVLSRAYRTIAARIEADIRGYGLNPTEFAVLELLYHKGEQPIQRLGDRVLLASGSMTYVVDKLESKGLLRRKPCPNDRRVTYAVITDNGRAVMADIFPHHREAIAEVLSGITDSEKTVLIDLLKKLGLSAKHSS